MLQLASIKLQAQRGKMGHMFAADLIDACFGHAKTFSSPLSLSLNCQGKRLGDPTLILYESKLEVPAGIVRGVEAI